MSKSIMKESYRKGAASYRLRGFISKGGTRIKLPARDLRCNSSVDWIDPLLCGKGMYHGGNTGEAHLSQRGRVDYFNNIRVGRATHHYFIFKSRRSAAGHNEVTLTHGKCLINLDGAASLPMNLIVQEDLDVPRV